MAIRNKTVDNTGFSNNTAAEGSLYTLTVGPITDPGADTRSGYTIAWGDGSVDSIVINQSSGVPEIDAAVVRIVQALSPYAPFPRDLAAEVEGAHDDQGAVRLTNDGVAAVAVGPAVASSTVVMRATGTPLRSAAASAIPGKWCNAPQTGSPNWGWSHSPTIRITNAPR